nr:hypothetical protein [uncultured Arsenicibacter sp.]
METKKIENLIVECDRKRRQMWLSFLKGDAEVNRADDSFLVGKILAFCEVIDASYDVAFFKIKWADPDKSPLHALEVSHNPDVRHK